MIDYAILPVVMDGTVRDVSGDGLVKVGLRGRLGVLWVPLDVIDGTPRTGARLELWSSYVWTTDAPSAWGAEELFRPGPFEPTIVSGEIVDVNDTAMEAHLFGGRARVMVPRRMVFTDVRLETARHCELYLSRMRLKADELDQEVSACI